MRTALGYTNPKKQESDMEAERINQIEATLEDLSTRTQELRRYL